ncbi:Uncharacterised protein [Mycobacteroides abscessus]|nr:Uncharacterised protein [Mycobacteroides abscessus]
MRTVDPLTLSSTGPVPVTCSSRSDAAPSAVSAYRAPASTVRTPFSGATCSAPSVASAAMPATSAGSSS